MDGNFHEGWGNDGINFLLVMNSGICGIKRTGGYMPASSFIKYFLRTRFRTGLSRGLLFSLQFLKALQKTYDP